ncbi:hypothetical protein PMAYCL1PPCAC_11559, partial [Pristionchus mayeri]
MVHLLGDALLVAVERIRQHLVRITTFRLVQLRIRLSTSGSGCATRSIRSARSSIASLYLSIFAFLSLIPPERMSGWRRISLAFGRPLSTIFFFGSSF